MANYLVREQAEFAHGKTPIIAKYVDEHHKLFSEIAGRGFLALPGYAYSAENGIEFIAKSKLSELNFKILSDTIEHELKQTGIDYGVAYKNALMAWELEKQALMSAWEAELATLKQGMASDEETLNLLAIEVSKRANVLLAAKTAIDVAMEADRKAITELDATVAPYEVQLANARLLTAQKKLELLPIIETIVVKEQELLVIEQGKAAQYTLYMAAENELMIKKQTLTPFINTLAAKSEQYAADITNIQIPIETQIANEKVTQADIAVQKMGYQVQEINIETANEGKKIQLLDKNRLLQIIKFNNEQTLTTRDINLTGVYHNTMMDDFNIVLQEERDSASNIVDDRKESHTITNATKQVHAATIAGAEINAEYQRTAADVNNAIQTATLKAKSEITAGLTHLIGQ